MNTEPTDNGQRTTDNGRETEHMSKVEAVGILLRLAYKRTTTRDEVVAIQVACRSTLKRFFDRERNWKRRHDAEIAAEYHTPQAALDLIAGERPLDAMFTNPPMNEAANE